jgi:hypothetical protein
MDSSVVAKLGAILGLLGVVGNILGVVVLGPIPAAYRPGTIAEWARQTMAAPMPATVSAVGFTLGLVALAGWAVILGLRIGSVGAIASGGVIAVGALLNAAGTMGPVVVAWHLPRACAWPEQCVPAAVSLLGLSLSLDALFNLLLGCGLIGLAVAGTEMPVYARVLVAIAGVASVPVSLQFYSDAAARMLVLAGPLWLAGAALTSWLMWRGRI